MKYGVRLVSLVFAVAAFSSCGSNTNILNNIDVKVSQQNQDSFITLSAKLNLGNAVLDQIQIPIADPHTGLNVGYVGMSTDASGSQMIQIGVNASTMLHADPTLGATLPNGRELPASLGAAAGEILGFPILNYSRIYIGGDLKNKVYIGAALSIKGLDGITNVVGMPANVFFGMNVNANLFGLAGVYGSPVANQSGIAVFGRLQLQQAPSTSPGVITLAKSAAARVSNAVSSAGSSLANSISSQGTNDSDNLAPRSERKLINVFHGRARTLRVQ